MGSTNFGGLWFQLYPTPDREITKQMLNRAEDAGATAVALTVDTPVVGHREKHPDFLERMIAKGWLGAKTNLGFYRHQKGRKTLNRGVRALVHQVGIRPAPPAPVRDQLREVRNRLIGAMIEEAKRCRAEGVVASADELNLALALTGWAPHRGGPLRCVLDP